MKEQFAVLKYRYGDEHFDDTTFIGWGRCHLIKSSYYYFGIIHKKDRAPRKGDLLYTTIKVPVVYKGLLLLTGTRAISFTKVDESQFFYGIEIF